MNVDYTVTTEKSYAEAVILSQFFPHANLGNLPIEVDEIIRGIIDKSKV